MFTGLVQAVGTLTRREGDSIWIAAPAGLFAENGWVAGESVAVNGCCLTLVDWADGLRFELSPETFERTNFGAMQIGTVVNLERAMRLSDRLGGHIVQGHVDGLATCEAIHDHGPYHEFVFGVEKANDRYFIEKGSVALDGISLTVVSPTAGRFSCWIIPTTFRETNLSSMKVGQQVHLEVDMIAKYVEKLICGREHNYR